MNKSLLLSLLALATLGVIAWMLTRRPSEPSVIELDEQMALSQSPQSRDSVANLVGGKGADSQMADPRLTFPTIFRNVNPQVGYVGDSNWWAMAGSIGSAGRYGKWPRVIQ